MIDRLISLKIDKSFFKGKAIVIFGPRQSGKTTLVEALLKERKEKYLVLSADEPDVRELFSNAKSTRIKSLIGKAEIIFIDEAQLIENTGITLKLIADKIKYVQLIATGSSAFELTDKIKEPLTGRKYEFNLLPLSFEEMVNHHGLLEEKRLIEHRLIYGYYPEIVTKTGEEETLLKFLAGNYLYKDLLKLDRLKKPSLLEKILKALALQIGSEVSYYELSQMVSADAGTVETYIDLLEKSYVIFKLTALSGNVRNEIKKGKKIYFYDNGIRNTILRNFDLPALRTDIGALWENFIISERVKFLAYHQRNEKSYFWRTTQQQEVDYIEEQKGIYRAFEFKWNKKAKAKFPKTFTNNYKISETTLITPGNFETFIFQEE